MNTPTRQFVLMLEDVNKTFEGFKATDLLVINKTDLAEAVGADLKVTERDTKKMRGNGPFIFAQVKHGVGVEEIVGHILHQWKHASGISHGN